MADTEDKISVSDLTVVFGDRTQQALNGVQAGKTREEIMQETGSVVALRDISFSVAPGEVFVVMGLSGSGKSTLIRCLNRLIEPTQGTVHIGGRNILELSTDELTRFRRESFGMVFQNFALFPNRTVRDNVAFGLELRGVKRWARNERADEVLSVVGLERWADSPVASLSGGMQQRVGLARALAIDPDILLMDEPFSALDPLIRSRMQDELLRLEQELKKTIVFITHDLNEAIKMGDKVGIVNSEGELVQVGTPEDILLHPADAYVQSFIGDVDRPAVLRVESVMVKPQKKLTQKPDHAAHPLNTIKDVLYYVMTANEPVPVFDGDEHVGDIVHDRVAELLKYEQPEVQNTANT